MQLINTGPEPFFEDVVDHMAAICHAPIALVALKGGRQWVNGRNGARGHEADANEIFCAREMFCGQRGAVDDAPPPVSDFCLEFGGGASEVPRAFIGVALVVGGEDIGDLYIADTAPRAWTAFERSYMERSARLVASHFEARAALAERDRRIALERELAEAGALYHAVVSTMQEGVVVQSASGRIITANAAALSILGLTEDDICGRTCLDPRFQAVNEDGEDLPGESHPAMVALATGQKVSGFIMGVENAAKGRRWLELDATPMVAPGASRPHRVVVTVRDVTERREKANQLAEALQRAEQGATAKQQFLANMSHEIRTPLNGVLGMAQVLERTKLSPEQSDCVGTILESGRGLMTLLNDVLDLSKIEAGKFSIVAQEESLAATLEQVARLWAPKAEAAGLALDLTLDGDLPAKMRFDAGRVQQCATNLVSNAIKFTKRGRVAMQASASRRDDGQIEVTVRVSDTGVGMDAETQARLFQPFEQADGTISRDFGGTGLGLSLVRRLSQLMGGDVGVTSAPGRGSVFTFTFLASPVETVAPRVAPIVAQSGAAPAAGRMRVLLVDDNTVNRTVARLFMRPHDIEIVEAENGEQALARLGEGAFDVVLMDVHMPLMDGPTTVRAMRASGAAWADIPVIALTADAMTGDKERFIGLGMDGYLSKPLAERELIAEIHRVHAQARKTARAKRVA